MTETKTLPIALTPTDVKWIKLCKGHYKDKYPYMTTHWLDALKPIFIEIYQYDPNEHYYEFTNCMFKRLLEILQKISESEADYKRYVHEVFNASFEESVFRKYPLPIERAVAELCSIIQNNLVIKDGAERYSLEET